MKFAEFLKKTAAKIAAWKVFIGIYKVAQRVLADFRAGIGIVPEAWSLYVILLTLTISNLIVWLNSDFLCLKAEQMAVRVIFYITLTLGSLLIILLLLEVLRHIKDCNLNGEDVARFHFFYWTVNGISRLTDTLMIGLIVKHGLWMEMAIIQPLYLLICIWNMVIYDKFQQKGFDLLQINTIRKRVKRPINTKTGLISLIKVLPDLILKKTMERRWAMLIFGSLFFFEADIVTLLLRKKQKVTFEEIFKITLPSNLICITTWSIIFWLGVKGFMYFKWFIK